MSVDGLTARIAPEIPRRSDVRPGLPLARWISLAGLLVAEIVLLTVRFDTATLGDNPAWWAVVLRQSSLWLRLGIAAAAATLLVSGASLWDDLRRLHGRLERASGWWPCLLCHAVAYAAFFSLTAGLLEGNLRATAWPSGWFLLWLATGALTLVLVALAALPAPVWLRLARRGRKGLALGGLVGLAALLASYLTNQWWRVLADSTFWVVQSILSLFYANLASEPGNLVLGTSAFQVEIAPECSGYEGMGLISVFTLVYLAVFRERLRFPHALVLLPLGAVVIWFCNAVRLATLIAIGTAGWPDIALGGFHSQAGWLIFNGVALGLVACSGRLGLLTAEAQPAGRLGRADPTLGYLAPFLALLATRMLAQAFVRTPEALYPLQLVAAVAALAWFRKTYGPIAWSWSWPAVALGAGTALVWAGWVLTLGAGASGPPVQAADSFAASWAGAWGLVRILGYALVVPVVEELAFRGYLLRRLIAADFQSVPSIRFTWLSFAITSVLFGALHGANWLPGCLAGLLFALALYHRGRLGDAITAHVTANSLLALFGLVSHNGHLLS